MRTKTGTRQHTLTYAAHAPPGTSAEHRACFTPKRSLVRTQYRPPSLMPINQFGDSGAALAVEVDMLPAQRPQLLGPRASEQRDHEVGVQPIGPRSYSARRPAPRLETSIGAPAARWHANSGRRDPPLPVPGFPGPADVHLRCPAAARDRPRRRREDQCHAGHHPGLDPRRRPGTRPRPVRGRRRWAVRARPITHRSRQIAARRRPMDEGGRV
jgi:hypothetical protein